MFRKEIENNNPLVEHTTKIGATRMTLRKHPGENIFPYYDRTDTTLDWQWIHHPISEKVQEILKPLNKFIDCITRVSIQIQPQDKAALPHWDDGGFRKEKWPKKDYHGQVIRAPLTTMNDNRYIDDLINAPFFAVINGRKINVSSDNHLFSYDVRKTFHGGDHRPWARGILGIFGMPCKNLPKIPLRITSNRSIKDFNEWKTSKRIYEYFYKRSPELFTIYTEYLKYTVGDDIFEKLMEIYNDRLLTN